MVTGFDDTAGAMPPINAQTIGSLGAQTDLLSRKLAAVKLESTPSEQTMAAVVTAGGMRTSPEGNMIRKDTKEQVGPNELRVVTEKVSKQNNVIQRDDTSMALLPNMGSVKGTFIG